MLPQPTSVRQRGGALAPLREGVSMTKKEQGHIAHNRVVVNFLLLQPFLKCVWRERGFAWKVCSPRNMPSAAAASFSKSYVCMCGREHTIKAHVSRHGAGCRGQSPPLNGWNPKPAQAYSYSVKFIFKLVAARGYCLVLVELGSVCVWSGVWCQCNIAGERWSGYRTGGRGASESHLWNFLGIDALAGYRVSEHLIAVRFFVGWTFLYQFHKLLDAVLYSFSRILFNLFVIHLSRKIDFPMLFQKLGFWHCFANDLLPYKQSFYCSKITSRGAANRRSLDDIFPPTLYL